VAFARVPAGQTVHVFDPGCALNESPVQLVHGGVPVGLNVPGWQIC
jgi:hypothetical protein